MGRKTSKSFRVTEIIGALRCAPCCWLIMVTDWCDILLLTLTHLNVQRYVENFDIKVTISIRYDISNRYINTLDISTQHQFMHWKLMQRNVTVDYYYVDLLSAEAVVSSVPHAYMEKGSVWVSTTWMKPHSITENEWLFLLLCFAGKYVAQSVKNLVP